MVDQRKFDELVENTTKYLTDTLKRLSALEDRVKELEQKKPLSRTRKDNADE